MSPPDSSLLLVPEQRLPPLVVPVYLAAVPSAPFPSRRPPLIRASGPRRQLPEDEEHQRRRRNLAARVVQRVSHRVVHHVQAVFGLGERARADHHRADGEARGAHRRHGANLPQLLLPPPALRREASKHREEPAAVHDKAGGGDGAHEREKERRYLLEDSANLGLRALPRPQRALERVHERVDADERGSERAGREAPGLVVDLGPEQDEQGVGGEE
mmetsp:Transcript_3014/g.12318  ORF Transcript_3014/g.12318 Transcript_3014/m.12318 type:complete len:216 (-) Transcript_3014:478-1125(-)